jgi:hypothetical protein
MMRTLAAAVFALFIISVPARADAPLIVIDRWWGVDYAKNGGYCFRKGKDEALCDQERTEIYNVFELEIKTQFASAEVCAGIAVSSFGYPQNRNEPLPDLSGPYWSLSVNYFGHEPAQLWQMLPPKGSRLPMMQATGTPSEIAAHVCTIIKGKGGALLQ